MRNQAQLVSLLVLMMVVLAGCDVGSGARWLDSKLGEILSALEQGGVEPVEQIGGGQEAGGRPESRDDLSAEARDKIEAWLAEQGLNRFGDPPDTEYASGTPLIDQATGKAIERFQYILDRHPDILDKINTN